MRNIFLSLLVLVTGCAHSPKEKSIFSLNQPPVVMQSAENIIYAGGFSGLTLVPKNQNSNRIEFYTVTDRGPNGQEMVSSIKVGKKEISQFSRVFFYPEYNPKIYKIGLVNAEVKILSEIPLRDTQGNLMSGLPNREYLDEKPLDSKLNPIQYDLNGIDSESIALDQNGNFWIGDEYLPSVFKFSPNGQLLKKYIPFDSYTTLQKQQMENKHGKNTIKEVFPSVFNQKAMNRGFEALSIFNEKLYILFQSSLRFEKQLKSKSKYVRLTIFDIESEKLIGEYIYQLENYKNKIGDMAFNSQGELFVLEQDGVIGSSGFRKIYKINLATATNILNHQIKIEPEAYSNNDSQNDFQPVTKFESLDLVKAGFNQYEKIEGMTFIDDHKIALTIDNDFGIENNKVISKIQSIVEIFNLP